METSAIARPISRVVDKPLLEIDSFTANAEGIPVKAKYERAPVPPIQARKTSPAIATAIAGNEAPKMQPTAMIGAGPKKKRLRGMLQMPPRTDSSKALLTFGAKL